MIIFGDEITLSHFLISLIGGYLLGSLPFGLILSKLAGHGDIRKIGSGNIGATNVLRTGNKWLALATLLLDGGKGAIAVMLASFIFMEQGLLYVAGFSAFMGHLYPLYLKFKGGKGLATFLGIMLALYWPLGVACCLTWLITTLLFRMSSLSGLVASLFSPFYSYFIFGDYGLAIFSAILCIMIFMRHKDNIKRIFSGTEPKIGKS
ncbi:MAG: glycerol-3-phosphate 1-O-acyltransferase PlsY [Emcibacter sp.]|nr:glycerol-3-phosphate 1-O-acyltransferase PlsY [Emcibacter sp.]